MKIGKFIGAFASAFLVAYTLAAIFYTNRVLAGQASFGARYTPAQQFETLFINFAGLWKYGVTLALALLVGFIVAALVTRVLKPLAPIAFPLAGALAVFALLALVETQLGGGAGVMGGARTPFGVALQCLAGLSGGVVFAALKPRR